MITLYQFEISPFCDKIRRILNVKHVPYAIEEVPPTKTLFASTSRSGAMVVTFESLRE